MCFNFQIRSFLRCKWRLCLLSAGIRQLFFVFINFTLGSLKSKLVWDYGWRPMFPAVIAVVVCTFIIVLWNTSYSFLTLESITRIGLSSISYAGFLSVWLVQHPLPLIWLTNFYLFSQNFTLIYSIIGLDWSALNATFWEWAYQNNSLKKYKYRNESISSIKSKNFCKRKIPRLCRIRNYES